MAKTNVNRMIALFTSMIVFLVMSNFNNEFFVFATYENTHINTGNPTYDIVEVAKTQIGYQERYNNDTKYSIIG